MNYKRVIRVNSIKWLSSSKKNIESQSRGAWKERDRDDLTLIHNAFAALKKLHGGYAKINALEFGHVGPELSENNPASMKKMKSSGMLKQTRVYCNTPLSEYMLRYVF